MKHAVTQRSSWRARILAAFLTALLAGAGALALRAAIDGIALALLGGDAAGLAPGLAAAGRYGGELAGLIRLGQPWLLPIMAAGGFVLAVVVSRLGGAGVAGTDGVIAAINNRDAAGLHLRGAGAKLASTALTIGSGGSAGTEGPVAQIGASVGAFVSRRTRLTPADTALLVAAGLAGGVGALFQSPIGGAILAAEVLRRRGADWRMLVPGLLVAPGAFAVYAAVHGTGPMFWDVPAMPWWEPHIIGLLALVGLLCGLLARLYVVALFSTERWLRPARKASPLLTAAVGGVVVGLIGIVMPMALGTGYGTIRDELSTNPFATLPLWIVLLLPFVKITTTAITLGSGGIGGVFGPAMVTGAAAGTLCWRLATDAGLQAGAAAAFALTGLAACLGPAVHAPIAAIMIAIEAAGYQLPPAGIFLAVAIAVIITRSTTLFPSQPQTGASAGRRAMSWLKGYLPSWRVLPRFRRDAV